MPSKEKKQVILSSRNNREKQVVIKECDFLKDGTDIRLHQASGPRDRKGVRNLTESALTRVISKEIMIQGSFIGRRRI